MASLTSSQEEALDMFMEITTETNREKSIQILSKFGWSIEGAILYYTAGTFDEESSENDSNQSDGEDSIASNLDDKLYKTSLSRNGDHSQSTTSTGGEFFLWNYIYDSVYYVITFPFVLVGGVLNYLKTLIIPTNNMTDTSSITQFDHIFTKDELPCVLKTSIEAISITEMQDLSKIMLIVVIKDFTPASVNQIKEILLKPDIRKLLIDNFIIYGSIPSRTRPFSYAQNPFQSYPFFQIRMHPQYRHMPQSLVYEGERSMRSLVIYLERAIARKQSYESRNSNRRQVNIQRHSLMQEQRREYMEALSRDMDKQAEQIKKEQLEQEKKLKIDQIQQRIVDKKQKFVQIRNYMNSNVHESIRDSFSVKVKYPDGYSTYFEAHHQLTITWLHHKIISLKEDLETNFHIYHSYPKEKISYFNVSNEDDDVRTLDECNLNCSRLIMVEYSSSDEDIDENKKITNI